MLPRSMTWFLKFTKVQDSWKRTTYWEGSSVQVLCLFSAHILLYRKKLCRRSQSHNRIMKEIFRGLNTSPLCVLANISDVHNTTDCCLHKTMASILNPVPDWFFLDSSYTQINTQSLLHDDMAWVWREISCIPESAIDRASSFLRYSMGRADQLHGCAWLEPQCKWFSACPPIQTIGCRNRNKGRLSPLTT